jgi:hypothetical protein
MAVEGTENAIHRTKVRVVRVRIKHECDAPVGIDPETDFAGEVCQIKKIAVAKEVKPFFTRDALSAPDVPGYVRELHASLVPYRS